MLAQNFRFIPQNFCENEKKLMYNNNIKIVYDENYNCYYVSFMFMRDYNNSYCWNINILKSILKLLKNGMDRVGYFHFVLLYYKIAIEKKIKYFHF